MFTMLFFVALALSVSYGLYVLEIPQIVSWKIMLIIVLVLNVLDWHSSFLNMKGEGPSVEANPILKLFWKKGGIFLFSLFKLLFYPVIIFFLFYSSLLLRERFFMQAGFTLVFAIIVIYNYIMFFKGCKKNTKNNRDSYI